MKAEEARRLTEDALEEQKKADIDPVLYAIRRAAEEGKTKLHLLYANYPLVKALQALGYDVRPSGINPLTEYYVYW